MRKRLTAVRYITKINTEKKPAIKTKTNYDQLIVNKQVFSWDLESSSLKFQNEDGYEIIENKYNFNLSSLIKNFLEVNNNTNNFKQQSVSYAFF